MGRLNRIWLEVSGFVSFTGRGADHALSYVEISPRIISKNILILFYNIYFLCCILHWIASWGGLRMIMIGLN